MYAGSIPTPASTLFFYLRITACSKPCRPDGEIGRRKRLKISRWLHRAGSIPAPGTKYINTLCHPIGSPPCACALPDSGLSGYRVNGPTFSASPITYIKPPLGLFDYSTDIGQRNVRHGRPSDGTLRTKGCLGRMPEAGRSRKHVLQPGPQ